LIDAASGVGEFVKRGKAVIVVVVVGAADFVVFVGAGVGGEGEEETGLFVGKDKGVGRLEGTGDGCVEVDGRGEGRREGLGDGGLEEEEGAKGGEEGEGETPGAGGGVGGGVGGEEAMHLPWATE